MKELRELLELNIGFGGDSLYSLMGWEKLDMSGGRWDQHRKRYGDIKGKTWLPIVSTVEVHSGLSSTCTQKTEVRGSLRWDVLRHTNLTENTSIEQCSQHC